MVHFSDYILFANLIFSIVSDSYICALKIDGEVAQLVRAHDS